MKNLHKIIYITIASLSLSALIQANAQIVISEVDSAGSGTSTYAADWFELTNTGSSAVNITGWKMDDSSDLFGSAVPMSLAGNSIAAGQTVVFIETTSATLATLTPEFEAAWFGSNVPAGFTIGGYGGSGVGLSTGGDAVNIFDALGNAVTGVTFGAPTGKATFDNTAGLSGAISTASVIGTNGAFTSVTGGEIGSPGVDTAVVPEPSTYALLFGGFVALLAIQFRRRNGVTGTI